MLSRFLQNELLPHILPSNYLPWYLSAVSSSVKCLYISIAFHRLCYPLLITLRIILIHLKRLFLLKTIRHYHTYHEVLDFTYRPIGLYLLFSFNSCLLQASLYFNWLSNRLVRLEVLCNQVLFVLLTVYYHMRFILSTILLKFFIFLFIIYLYSNCVYFMFKYVFLTESLKCKNTAKILIIQFHLL